MTTTSSPTQVRCGDDGRLTARCVRCGLGVVQLPDVEVRAALEALDADHGDDRPGCHPRTAPAGWALAAGS